MVREEETRIHLEPSFVRFRSGAFVLMSTSVRQLLASFPLILVTAFVRATCKCYTAMTRRLELGNRIFSTPPI
jgi:hypothetical protein